MMLCHVIRRWKGPFNLGILTQRQYVAACGLSSPECTIFLRDNLSSIPQSSDRVLLLSRSSHWMIPENVKILLSTDLFARNVWYSLSASMLNPQNPAYTPCATQRDTFIVVTALFLCIWVMNLPTQPQSHHYSLLSLSLVDRPACWHSTNNYCYGLKVHSTEFILSTCTSIHLACR